MRRNGVLYLANILSYCLILMIFAVLQTGLWSQAFGTFPAPLFVIPVIVFLSLYHNVISGTVIIYFGSLFFAFLTSMKIGLLMLILLACYFTIHFFKQRFFESGMRYFIMTTVAATLAFHVYQILFSILSGYTVYDDIFHRLIQLCFAPIVALPTYKILSSVDKITEIEIHS